MTFINETISEVDKEKFYSFNFKNPVTLDPVKARKWTIDRESNAFLIGLGGQGSEFSEIPMFYAFVWKNDVIMMETFSRGTGNAQSGVELWWKITRIEIPEKLKSDKEVIVEQIKKAFDEYGSFHRRDHVKGVYFDVIAEPVFVRKVK
ncbi:hypothetical protein P9E76_08600 [Schinkia azotoformans]|uniref:Uncharacterized protein n=1 Tax=Schinkia azotoformans LMG 9581 TaxID=1131731 RepID=K6DQ36_SCHAZ|nr:hypothetical protein [Schinkia azotoformans]EKN62896.1 hypothetical protein BAZO_20063 [Schinkia azotoformans LMG 9581]MEC1641054.1 hypothetical protein [Schinkia azotoformans]MEC1945104.1 hypothetical protein [Schinkia azotoformans]